MGKCDLPAWVAPQLPPVRKRVSRRRMVTGMSVLATWPFPAEQRLARSRSRAMMGHERARAAKIAAAGGEEAWRAQVHAARVAGAMKTNAKYWPTVSVEERRRRMSEMGKLGGGKGWRDQEAKRAHLAKLGRARAQALNARLAAMPEEERRAWLAERGRRVSAGRARNKALKAAAP